MKIFYTLITVFFILGNFAFSQDLRKRLGRSVSNRDSAELIFEIEKHKLQNAADSGIYWYFVAEMYNVDLENEIAEETFLKSLQYLDPKVSSDLISLAYIRLKRLRSLGANWDQALAYAQKGLENSTSALDSNFMGYALLDISDVYHNMEDYAKGVEYGKKAYQLLTHFSKANPTFIAFSLNAIGINFDDWGKPDSALFYHYRVLENIENLDSARVSFTFNNIGNTLLKKGEYAEAESWIETAVKLNTKANNHYSLAANYTNLASIAFNLKAFSKAEVLMDSAFKYVELSKSTEKKRDYLLTQYKFHKAKGKLAQAIDFLEKYNEVRDSILKEERLKMLGELEAKYDVQTKERQLAESHAALVENELLVKTRNNQILLLVVALIIILGVAYFLYYRQKTKAKQFEQESKLQKIMAGQETQKQLSEQRNRIASDLHDNIGAQLTFIISSLNNLKYMELTKEQISAKVDTISTFTVTTINELRDTIWAMNKDNISMEDLRIKLMDLLAKAKSSSTDIAFELDIHPEVESNSLLNPLEGINLYRIAQEALNNAMKHSEANQIRVVFTMQEHRIKLCIQDNGKGFNHITEGNGLESMKNRAERISKGFFIETQKGMGTKVYVF